MDVIPNPYDEINVKVDSLGLGSRGAEKVRK